MIELNIYNLNKYYGGSQLFTNISFDIKSGEKVGLIGQNGCGKTTIMKILTGKEDYQCGEISVRKDARMGYLDQIPVYDKSVLAYDVLEAAFGDIYRIKKQMRVLEDEFTSLTGVDLDKAMKSYGVLTQEYETRGGYSTETRINKIAEGLKITQQMQSLSFKDLSGGEKTRVILAKILLEEPDILLLDEPSNHLDLNSIEWLEGFLKEYKGSVLVISHDRYFLDAVAGKIVELNSDHADVYQGNYSYYVIEKERRFLIDLKNYQNEQKKIDRMEQQIERYRIWGEMRDSEKMFKRAKELEKRLEKMDTPEKPLLNKRKIRLNPSYAGRSGKIVLEIQELSKSFGENHLLNDLNFTIFYQDSVCIIGKNGSGKTTFLKMIMGELLPDCGFIKTGSQVKIGYLPQQVTFEDEEQTVLDYFSRTYNITTGAARAQLAKVLFLRENVNKKIKNLSGGEKSRLKLCGLTFEGVNFLILDEPTNHLDIDSREVLEETLNEFDGTLLFVSHDRYFINKVADKIIAIEDSKIKVYDGDYSCYLEDYSKQLTQKQNLFKNAAQNTAAGKNAKNCGNKNDKPDGKNCTPKYNSARPKESGKIIQGAASKKKLEQLESEIGETEEKRKEIENLMQANNTDALRLGELFEEKKKMDRKLEFLYQQWEETVY